VEYALLDKLKARIEDLRVPREGFYLVSSDGKSEGFSATRPPYDFDGFVIDLATGNDAGEMAAEAIEDKDWREWRRTPQRLTIEGSRQRIKIDVDHVGNPPGVLKEPAGSWLFCRIAIAFDGGRCRLFQFVSRTDLTRFSDQLDFILGGEAALNAAHVQSFDKTFSLALERLQDQTARWFGNAYLRPSGIDVKFSFQGNEANCRKVKADLDMILTTARDQNGSK
jgi:hypothetical protein